MKAGKASTTYTAAGAFSVKRLKLWNNVQTMYDSKMYWSMGKRLKRMGEEVWHDGWPRQQGWYKCLIDGELEMQLKYYVCQVSMKPHWVDSNGDYIEAMGKVQWQEQIKHDR